MRYESVTDDRRLLDLCQEWATAPAICLDTEFVSEDTYRPELCLIQVAVGPRLYVIDPQSVCDLSPFWECLAAPGHTTIVHAGREELRFAWRAIGRYPHNVFDVQLAAGFVGLEYPAAYATLVTRLLQVNLSKGETRTNWRKRPLYPTQLEYALQDVMYLERLRDELQRRLVAAGRWEWLQEELVQWQHNLSQSETGDNWRRVSGATGLSGRSLAIVRELWHWREAEAAQRNMPARRLLRDDLLIELARRQSADPRRIRAVRGLERSNLQRLLPQIAARIERALTLPEEEIPRRATQAARPPLTLVGQFLATALGVICREARIAPALVGGAEDLRDLVAARLSDLHAGQPPSSLASGWRAQVVGRVVDQLLRGELAVRIADPLADQPLAFVPSQPAFAAAEQPPGPPLDPLE